MTAPPGTIHGDTNVLFLQPTTDPADPAQICNTAADFRSLISAMYQGRSGVITTADLAVTATAPVSPQVNIATGTGIVAGTTATNQESYMANVNSQKVLTPPGPPQNANRYDLIVLAINDGQVLGNHVFEWQIYPLSGAESSNPSVPAVPNDAIPLAQIIRRPGQANINAADITSLRTVVSILSEALPTRIRWSRSANIAAAAYTDVGTPPANPFISASVASLTSTFTVLQNCTLSILLAGSAAAAITSAVSSGLRLIHGPRIITVNAMSQGGNAWESAIMYSGYFTAGEAFTARLRNANVGALWNFYNQITALPANGIVIGS